MEELKTSLDADAKLEIDAMMPLEGEGAATRLGVRSYVNRRLFSALGEALFECQRFKSKENEAVATAEGQMAFIAMYLRKQVAAEAEKANPRKKKPEGS